MQEVKESRTVQIQQASRPRSAQVSILIHEDSPGCERAEGHRTLT